LAQKRLIIPSVFIRSHSIDSTIRLGFVPLVDCAPIAYAHETGLFEKWGLRVELLREPGWATIRDKLAHGTLDAAHAPVGFAFALSWGLGVLRRPTLSGLLLNSNGDAITLSRNLAEQGLTTPQLLAEEAKHHRKDRPFLFAVPHRFSTHHFLLLRWLRPAGMIPGKGFQVVVLPPSLMASCLGTGDIDGYCVGEPFNTLASREGSGIIAAESAQLSPLHPEKALIVPASFADNQPDEHLRLIASIAAACRLCETPAGREEVTEILSRPEYLGLDRSLIRSSLFPSDHLGSSISSKGFHVFWHPEINRPCSDKSNWILGEMRASGLIGHSQSALPGPLQEVFRPDLYDAALQLRPEFPQSHTTPSTRTKLNHP
jgi:ABC-type nitrate/sulfonate/bicarbonate transport system substrate-binding protein